MRCVNAQGTSTCKSPPVDNTTRLSNHGFLVAVIWRNLICSFWYRRQQVVIRRDKNPNRVTQAYYTWPFSPVMPDRSVLEYISVTLGWLYFFCWSISFYPQIISNFQHRSVTGLSVDFVIASFYGFLCYTIANLCFYAVSSVREEYRLRHDGNDSLVALNDVIFAAHAMVMTFVLCIQVHMYKKPNEGPSIVGLALAFTLTAMIITGGLLAYCRLVPMIEYLYALGYIKIALTVIKYIPQVWLNWVRRSTSGWNILNVLLDLAGGVLSMSQLYLDALASEHLAGIMGFDTKLVLGIVSIIFDTIFLLQHYLWFPDSALPRTIVSPVASLPSSPELKGKKDGKHKQ